MTLLFSHIQKTGGWQFYPGVIQRYGRDRVILVGSKETGGDIEGKDIRRFSGDDLGDIEAIIGHFTVDQAAASDGIAGWVKAKDPFIFSIVRNPIDRVESLYSFREKWAIHPQSGANKYESAETFAKRMPTDIQCQWLSYKRRGTRLVYTGRNDLEPVVYASDQIEGALTMELVKRSIIERCPLEKEKNFTKSGRTVDSSLSLETRLRYEAGEDMRLYKQLLEGRK